MKFSAALLLLVAAASPAHAALISLETVTPGSETVTLVTNGGFENGTGNTNPDSWSRVGQSFYDTPTTAGLTAFSNLPSSGKVAYYKSVVGTSQTGQYTQAISGLEENTDYVFSAYLWNNSVAAYGSSVAIVMDFSDHRPDGPGTTVQEPQQVFQGSNTDAAKGYFAYQTFNTGTLKSTSFAMRIFASPTTYIEGEGGLEMFAWDNVAITKASDFVAPTLIPEPSASMLGGLGLLALLRSRRRC